MRIFECVAVASPSFSKSQTLLDELAPLANRVVANEALKKWSASSLAEWIWACKADCVVIGTEVFRKELIDQLPPLLAVGKYGVGCDNVDTEYLKAKNIFFAWQGGVNRRTVAELVLGFMLGHARNIFYSIDQMQSGSWQKDGGVDLSSQTVGIVGLGYVGSEVAKLLKAFGTRIIYFDTADKAVEARKLEVQFMPYSELLRVCDIITFHVPGGASTRHLFGTPELSRVKPNVLIINTSRGEVCDFRSTTDAVLAHRIAGFACDVFVDEPFENQSYPIKEHIYLTPHIGANTQGSVLAMGRAVISQLKGYLEGTAPRTL